MTSATGYVGGRLVPRLLQEEYRVRVLARDPVRLQGRSWLDRVEVAQGDVLQVDTLHTALQDIQAAAYLIHSMMAGTDFHQRDLTAARNFGAAAARTGLGRVLYLGGLGNPGADLSLHLRSRQLTGEALRGFNIPVLEFRTDNDAGMDG